MPGKTIAREPVGCVCQRREVVIPRKIFEKLQMREGDLVAFAEKENGVLIKPKRVVDPDDVLTREESALVSKARREMREGKYVSLAQLEHDLARKRSTRRRKTA
jgi:bifunctional DNA-binding transcriptional regulator/antitoxin component of YhaV-PrlF toxin-antitoxin module